MEVRKYTKNVTELAEQMGVAPADVMMLAKSVVNSIEKDKAVDAFMAASEETQNYMASAYAAHAVRKFEQFMLTYLTRTGAKEAFFDAVFLTATATPDHNKSSSPRLRAC